MLVGDDKDFVVPIMADAAGVGGGIDARPPIGFGSASASANVVELAGGKGSGFFNSDEVVFEAEEGVDLVFVQVMAGNNAGAILESERCFIDIEPVRQGMEETVTQIMEVFEVGFEGFAKQQTFEAGHPLRIVSAHLGEEPMGFATAASATETDRRGAFGPIAEASRCAGSELLWLKNNSCADEILQLIGRTACQVGIVGEEIGCKIVELVQHG